LAPKAPENTAPWIASLIESCSAFNSKERPNFKKICEEVESQVAVVKFLSDKNLPTSVQSEYLDWNKLIDDYVHVDDHQVIPTVDPFLNASTKKKR